MGELDERFCRRFLLDGPSRRLQHDVADSVVPVDVRHTTVERARERVLSALEHRHVLTAGELKQRQRVDRRLVRTRVAADGSYRHEINLRGVQQIGKR